MTDDEPTLPGPPLTRRQFVGVTGATALAGCLDVQLGDDPETLEFAVARPPLTLDPLTVTDAGSAHIVNQVVESLYEYDPDLTLDPVLAADTPTVTRNGRRYIVPIDTDAHFPDGDPVTAGDVIHSYTAPRIRNSPLEDAVEMIDSMIALDDRTVQFDLTYPYQPFPAVLTRYVVDETAVARAVDDPAEQAAARLRGSGPFNFDSRLEDGGVRLTRWDNYWGTPTPGIDAVEFRPVPDGTKRVVTVKASEADVIDEIPPPVWQTLTDLEPVSLTGTPGLGYYYLAFNCRAGPTTDPQVREAIDYVVDLDAVVAEHVTPIGDRLYAPVPKQVSDAWTFPTDEWATIPHDRDIDRAAELLEDSDAVPTDWEARFIVPPDDTREQICEAVADGIRATGYRARVDRLDWSTFADTYTTGDPGVYTAYCLGWIDAPDPDRYLHPLFGPRAPGRTDGTYYTDVADTVRAAREADAESARRIRYIDAIETLLTDRAHLPLYTNQQTLGMVDRVQNMGVHPLEGFVLVGDGFNVTLTSEE